jgi:hypothetical protein
MSGESSAAHITWRAMMQRVEEQVAMIYLATTGNLDNVPVEKVREFEQDFIQVLRATENDTLVDGNKINSHIKEVNKFILELEDTEWSSHVVHLSNLLELSTTQSNAKQKLFNLIAKIKLAQELGTFFEFAIGDYNYLVHEGIKYFVHSARSAFAYIHPSEILDMELYGDKMALDFNTKSKVKIYHSAKEILQLNSTHLLVYQNEKSLEDLFRFCEINRDANKHLLIIDTDNSNQKSKDLMKLLNMEENDYR